MRALLDAARALDDGDPLASLWPRFARPDPELSYLDGNSLGRPTVDAAAAAARVIEDWGHELIGGWDHWIDRPLEVGDRLGPVLGCGPGRVLMGESTTVRLHQAVHAVVRARPDRRVLVAGRADFPTDRYVVAAVAREHGCEVRWVERHATDELVDAIDDTVAAVVSSVASFETAALVDVGAVTAAAHHHGVLVVWDCSHAAGAVPVDVDAHEVDVAVGCTYKYLHGGPGAPAFVALGAHVADELRQPIEGWFGQRDQFAMGPTYDPVPGIGQWRAGTPGIVALEVAATGIDVVADAGIDAIRAKSVALGELMVRGAEELLAARGFSIVGPRSAESRGGHLALRHPDASRIVRAGRAAGVVADHRPPDLVRLGPGPLATSATEVVAGVQRLADVVDEGSHLRLDPDPGRVT